jgi:hypothetical protein
MGDERHFLRLWLADDNCILVETSLDGMIQEGGTLQTMDITYKLAHGAVQEWPFAVFDLNRECLPAISKNVVVVSR